MQLTHAGSYSVVVSNRFGVLTSASLVGMASSPFIAGLVGGASIRIVFFVDLALMAMLALVVQKTMTD